MKILYKPQRSDENIEYQFNGDVITATYKGVTDTFDFSYLPDGKAENIDTLLEINPILSAERIDGKLKIVLLNFIGPEATDEEKFPKWMEV